MARAARWISGAKPGKAARVAAALGGLALAGALLSQVLFGPVGLGTWQVMGRPGMLVPDSYERTLAPHRDRMMARVPKRGDVVAGFEFLTRFTDRLGLHSLHHFLGGRYTKEDVAALVADTGVGAGKWWRLLARTVVLFAWERRPDKFPEEPLAVKKTEEMLQVLRDGERIFSFEQSADAGRMTHEREDASDVEARRGLTWQMRRSFGVRGNRREG